jgi:hypothetical protein
MLALSRSTLCSGLKNTDFYIPTVSQIADTFMAKALKPDMWLDRVVTESQAGFIACKVSNSEAFGLRLDGNDLLLVASRHL